MKYYLAFIFEKPDKDSDDVKIHCTHLYLGELNTHQLFFIVDQIKAYYNLFGPIKMKHIAFEYPHMFGENKEVRVLCTDQREKFYVFDRLLNALKAYGFGEDQFSRYPIWTPHITAEAHTIAGYFSSYALMTKNQVVMHWDIGKQL